MKRGAGLAIGTAGALDSDVYRGNARDVAHLPGNPNSSGVSSPLPGPITCGKAVSGKLSNLQPVKLRSPNHWNVTV